MLTAAQKVDVRRWCGYDVVGDSTALPFSRPVYTSSSGALGAIGVPGVRLDYRLDHLTDSEETVLIGTYLTPLAALETGILSTADNLDTDVAAVWERNKYEQRDRDRLFNSWRRKMCAFLGVPAGPGLGDGGMSLVRA